MKEPLGTSTKAGPSDNLLVNIFGRLWSLWGLISFILTFLLIFLPSMGAYLFKDYRRGQDYFIAVSRVWMWTWLRLIGCPVKVTGKEFFKPGKTYVIVYNHNALLDVPLSAPFVPGGNKTIAKASFANVPIFSWFYKRGSILVDRNDDKSRVKSFEEMKRSLRNGMHMCIYPEGTRNRTEQPLKKFYDGAFKLSVDTQNEMIPCVISGTRKAMPIHKTFFLWPTALQMDFLPPISPAGMDAKELKEKVFQVMTSHYLAKNG